MADDAPADEAPVTFHIKSSSDAKYTITLSLSTTVLDLKNKLSTTEYADIPSDRQRLIYSGRVLKDPDTLASYKIKEGNTVHLVKGAASNQRQNAANQATSSTTGTGATPTGVPTNLAAGTGQDPLAGLTGARYAGFAQMPNANMFGPDGGMGPPPDAESMASMLENPNFASTLNEALSNPQVIDQMIRSNPMFNGPMGNQAREMLRDPNFRRMMTDPETLRSMNQMRRQMPGLFGAMGGATGGDQAFPAPGVTDTTEGGERNSTPQQPNTTPQAPANPFAMLGNPGAGGFGGAGNPLAALFGPRGMGPVGTPPPTSPPTTGTQTTPPAGTANPPDTTQQQPPNPLGSLTGSIMQNPELMQQILAALNPGNNANPSSTTATDPTNPPTTFNPFAALQAMGMGMGGPNSPTPPAAPQDDRPPEDRYAEQLRQLNEMGFYEFERNVEALRRTGGSVQGAVEYLLTH